MCLSAVQCNVCVCASFRYDLASTLRCVCVLLYPLRFSKLGPGETMGILGGVGETGVNSISSRNLYEAATDVSLIVNAVASSSAMGY